MIANTFKFIRTGLITFARAKVYFAKSSMQNKQKLDKRDLRRSERSKSTDRNFWSSFKQEEYKMYFQPLYDELDSQSKEIINALNQESANFALITTKLSNYLRDKESCNFAQSVSSKVYLLTAIEMRTIFQESDRQRLRKQLVEHIIRHQTQNLILDKKSLMILVKNFNRYGNLQYQKAKVISFRYISVRLLVRNFNSIPLGSFPYIVNLIYTYMKTPPLDHFKYLKFSDLLQEKINRLLSQSLKQGILGDQNKFLVHHQFIAELLEIYFVCGLAKKEYGITLYQFLIKIYFAKTYSNPQMATSSYNIIFRFFPSDIVDENNQSLKSLLLQRICGMYQTNNHLSECIKMPVASQHLCYSILTHYFNQLWLKLHVIEEDGLSYISNSTEISPPVLPDFFWKMYRMNSAFLNNFPIIRETIKSCYPDQLIQTQIKKQKSLNSFVETEMSIRVTQCLKNLGIKFKAQMLIAGRFIDFFLFDNILLQIDGIFHYQSRVLAPDVSTNYRNLHLILSGYKLVTINIYQYNICRQTDQLSQLLTKKINLAKTKAIFVS